MSGGNIVPVDYDAVNKAAADALHQMKVGRELAKASKSQDAKRPTNARLASDLGKIMEKKAKGKAGAGKRKRSTFGMDFDEEDDDDEEQEEEAGEDAKKASKKRKEKQNPPAAPKPRPPVDDEQAARTVFVDNLAKHVKESELRELCGKVGEVTSTTILQRGGVSRGKGFVVFREPETVAKAVEQLNGSELGGEKIRVEGKGKKSGAALLPRHTPMWQKEGESDDRTIFIRGTTPTSSVDLLQAALKTCGNITNHAFVSCHRSAIVEMESAEAASKAMQLSGVVIDGNEVTITASKTGFAAWRASKKGGKAPGDAEEETKDSGMDVDKPIGSDGRTAEEEDEEDGDDDDADEEEEEEKKPAPPPREKGSMSAGLLALRPRVLKKKP